MKFNSFIILVFLSVFSLPASADSNLNSCNIGIGYTETYSGPEADGEVLTAGCELSDHFMVDLMYGRVKDDMNNDYSVGFIGFNIGHSLNTSWLNIYAKIGAANTIETKTETRSGSDFQYTVDETFSDYAGAFGGGIRLTPFDSNKGFYIALEAVNGYDSGNVRVISVGYKF